MDNISYKAWVILTLELCYVVELYSVISIMVLGLSSLNVGFPADVQSCKFPVLNVQL